MRKIISCVLTFILLAASVQGFNLGDIGIPLDITDPSAWAEDNKEMIIAILATLPVEVKEMIIATALEKNLDDVDLEEMPPMLKFILGKPNINIVAILSDGTEITYGFSIKDNKVEDFKKGGIDDPNYIIKIKERAFVEMAVSKDPSAKLTELYKKDEITVEAVTIGSKIKLFFGNVMYGLFGPEDLAGRTIANLPFD